MPCEAKKQEEDMLPTITFTSIETVAIYKNHHKYFLKKLKIMNGFIGSIIIGALAGWLVGFIAPKGKDGCIWNIIIGIVGGFIGGNVLSWIGVDWGGGFWGSLGTAVVGAAILLWAWNLIKK